MKRFRADINPFAFVPSFPLRPLLIERSPDNIIKVLRVALAEILFEELLDIAAYGFAERHEVTRFFKSACEEFRKVLFIGLDPWTEPPRLGKKL